MSPILDSIGSVKAYGWGKFLSVRGTFESLATESVGSGGAAHITFSSIPATYSHLQIRFIARFGSVAVLRIQANTDTGSNYSWKEVMGNGSSAIANAGYPNAFMTVAYSNGFSATADTFGVGVMDILDYANTSKYTTFRTLSGYDANGLGGCQFNSGAWYNKNAISSIKIFPNTSTFQQYSHFALYGIKGSA